MVLYLSPDTPETVLTHLENADVRVLRNRWVFEFGRCVMVFVQSAYIANDYWKGLGVRWIVTPLDPDADSNLHLREDIQILGVTTYPLDSKVHGE